MNITLVCSYARDVAALNDRPVQPGETIDVPDGIAVTLLEQVDVWADDAGVKALVTLDKAKLTPDDIRALAAIEPDAGADELTFVEDERPADSEPGTQITDPDAYEDGIVPPPVVNKADAPKRAGK